METMSFTGLTANAEMVGYCDGFALAKTEWGAILVSERPEEFYFPGQGIESEFFTPLSELPEEKQAKIHAYLEQQEGGNRHAV